ncbi:MAG: FAD-dependent oxidoreductase [Archaeoglobaceae archaeon]
MSLEVAVVGGGVAGLSAAYFLAKRGARVKVFEKKYLVYGASGRNSGGLTAQFEDELLVKLALRSLQLYDELQNEIGFNFLLRRSGYVKLASGDDVEKIEREAKFLRSLGVEVEILDGADVKELFPDINSEAFDAASYFKSGGVVFPWPVIWGLAKGCKKLGVEIYDYTPASVVVDGGSIRGVRANGEFHRADVVINAAGAWSNEVSGQAGVELNNRIVKEEICVTESLKPYIDPYFLDVSRGVYFTQSMRGEIVGGILGSEGSDMRASLDFLVKYAKAVTKLVPKLRGLSVLRQWAGVYDESPSGKPVVGFTSVEGFVQLNGFGRKGMSLALACGEEVAKLVFGEKSLFGDSVEGEEIR